MISEVGPGHSPGIMGHTVSVPGIDSLTFVGLERSHLRSAVYRRVFGDTSGPVRIGRYSILERIGAGARGVVFKAFDNQLDRLVALKVLSTKADDRDELVREAKALARLSHPNVLAVYEVGETEDEQLFLATEYVKGWTLRGWYEEEHRSEKAVVDVVLQAAAGVQAAHDEGLVHRDLKPANILVGEDGRVRVADFGLARFDPSALDPEADVPRDGFATTTAGTPGYMAPELFEGKPASAASDQYALAVTVQELLTAGPAVRSDTIAALKRALSETPEQRYPSVTALAEALARPKATRRRRGLYVGAAALLSAGGFAAATVLTPATESSGPDPDVAILEAQAALSSDPAAALEALRPLGDTKDERALSVAEKAIALGPEDASWALPEGARHPALWGDVLAYRDQSNQLVVHRLTTTEPSVVDAGSIGIEELPPTKTPKGPIVMGLSATIDGTGTMSAVAPWAARTIDRGNRRLGLSKDGSRIARIDRATQTITVDDTTTGETLWTHSQPAEHVNFVSLDDTGRRVAWADTGGEAFIHDLENETTFSLEPLASEVIFEPNGTSVVVHGHFSGVFRVRLSDGRVTRLIEEDKSFAQVEVSPDGTFVAAHASGNGFGTVGEVHVAALDEWKPRTLAGDGFTFSPEGSRIALYHGQEVHVRDLRSGDTQHFTVPGGVKSAEFSAEDELWAFGADNVVRHYSVEPSRALRGHLSTIYDIALSDDGSTAVSSSHDYTVRVWNVETGEGRILAEVDFGARGVALDDEGGQVAVTGFRHETVLYGLDGTYLGELPQSSARPQLTPDGDWVGAGKDGVWRSGREGTTVLTEGKCGALTVRGSLIAATCGESPRRLHVWDGEAHHSTPVEGKGFGPTLHSWPDRNHLVVLGGTPQLFRRIPGGALQPVDVPRVLAPLNDFFMRAVSSQNHDLVITRRDGVFMLRPSLPDPIRLLATDPGTALGISGDGRRVAHSMADHVIVIRDRAVPGSQRDLASVLADYTVVEGSL